MTEGEIIRAMILQIANKDIKSTEQGRSGRDKERHIISLGRGMGLLSWRTWEVKKEEKGNIEWSKSYVQDCSGPLSGCLAHEHCYLEQNIKSVVDSTISFSYFLFTVNGIWNTKISEETPRGTSWTSWHSNHL